MCPWDDLCMWPSERTCWIYSIRLHYSQLRAKLKYLACLSKKIPLSLRLKREYFLELKVQLMVNDLHQNKMSLPEVTFESSFVNWSLPASSSLCFNLFQGHLSGQIFSVFPTLMTCLIPRESLFFLNRLRTGLPRSVLSLKYWCAWSLVSQEVTCLGIYRISHFAGHIMTIHYVCEAKFLI